MIRREQVTGLILAGGRGSRMGGVDKGLQMLNGEPLIQHVLRRLAPQVGPLMINANRNLDTYGQFGVPVWPDVDPEFSGPLAGFLAGLSHCETDWLMTVPCDTPRFPLDLVERMTSTVASADIAVAVTESDDTVWKQPVFCLVRRSLHSDLDAYLGGGGRKIDLWFTRHACVDVPFEDGDAFFNANTLEELRQLGST